MNLRQARRQIQDLEDEAALEVRKAVRHGRGYARENPWKVIGAAAAVAGLVAAWLWRRRGRDGG